MEKKKKEGPYRKKRGGRKICGATVMEKKPAALSLPTCGNAETAKRPFPVGTRRGCIFEKFEEKKKKSVKASNPSGRKDQGGIKDRKSKYSASLHVKYTTHMPLKTRRGKGKSAAGGGGNLKSLIYIESKKGCVRDGQSPLD